MTFDLSSIHPTKQILPLRKLLHGPHGIGKSTFAAQAPRPIFICTEDGQDDLDAEMFPLCTSWQDIMSCITTLYMSDHEYKTVVLDSADWAEKLAHKIVCEKKNVTSIEDIGYQKGYVFAADYFLELIDGLQSLRDKKGMAVIILCHTEIKRFDDPLGASYDRYQLKPHKLVSKALMEWVDVVGFANQKTAVKSEDKGFNQKRGVAIDLEERIINLRPSPAYDAKTRYELPAEVPLVWSAFEKSLNEARKEKSNG